MLPLHRFDAEATVVVEGRLPSTKDIPASAVQGIEESQRLAELQRTISSWMERRRSKDANDDPPSGDEFKQHDLSRDMYLHRMTCSKQLALELTSELLGDNCDDETDPNKRFEHFAFDCLLYLTNSEQHVLCASVADAHFTYFFATRWF